MAMLTAILILLGGLALLIGGAELLVRGAVGLAQTLGVAPILVGLTVVAFGTSTPELVVNLVAAYRGQAEIGFGNIVGSNIANIGLLLGITGLLRPIVVHGVLVRREIPMMVLATFLVLVQGEDRLLTGRSENVFDRDDGITLLLLFCVFLFYTVGDALRGGLNNPHEPVERVPQSERPQGAETAALPHAAEGAGEGEGRAAEIKAGGVAESAEKGAAGLLKFAGLIAGGLVLLVVGGQLTVSGATTLARSLGVSEVIIGLTLVAVGTSLPELATNLVAIVRKQGDLAVGNIVGSNIFNLLFVMGITATISPVKIPESGVVDLMVMTGFALLLVPLAMVRRRIDRFRAAVLLAAYLGYIVWLAMRG